MSVRVRFAPSPTGALHVGGVRTALTMALYLGAFVIFAMGTIAVATLSFPVEP